MSVATHHPPRATPAGAVSPSSAGIALAAVAAAIVISSSGGSSPTPAAAPAAAAPAAAAPAAAGAAPANALVPAWRREHDGVLGDPEAKKTLTEFVDLQCPICAASARDDAPHAHRATTSAPARSSWTRGRCSSSARTPSTRRPLRRGRPRAGPAVAVPRHVLRRPGRRRTPAT